MLTSLLVAAALAANPMPAERALVNPDVAATPTMDLVSEALRTVASCPATCTTFGCWGGRHKVTEEDGNAYGPDHNCTLTTEGCEYHQCFNEEQQEAMNTLVDVLPGLTGDELLVLTTREPTLLINAERRTIQVFGCGEEQVVANLPLSLEQQSVLLD